MTSMLAIYPKTIWNPMMGKRGCENYIVRLYEIEDFNIVKNPYYIGEVLGMPPIKEQIKMLNYADTIKEGMKIFECNAKTLKEGPLLDIDKKGRYGYIKLEPRFKTTMVSDVKPYLIIQL